MRGGRLVALGLVLTVWPPDRLSALQCPDGSPPPCRAAGVPASARAAENILAVLPFRVTGASADVEWLREGMMDLLGTSLDGVAGWRVVNPRAVLSRVGRFAPLVDVVGAARVAQAVGASGMVLGSAVVVGKELRLRAELYDATTARQLGMIEARGALTNPAPLVDSLAVGLALQRLATRPGTPNRLAQEYATASPQALRAYLASGQLARRDAWQAAADSLLQAIARDSTFGLAYYRLYVARTFGATTPGWDSHLHVLRAGVRHVDRLPQRQRDLLLTALAQQEGLRAEALRLADELGRNYPDDAEAAYAEGESYFHFGLELGEPPERALAAFQRAVDLDPGLLDPYVHLIELLCVTADTTRAWRALQQALTIGPSSWAIRGLELAMRVGLRGEAPASLARELLPLVAGGLAPLLLRARFEALRLYDHHPTLGLAVADTIAAVAAAPDRPRSERLAALLARARHRLTGGRHAQAWRTLDEASVLDPISPDVLSHTALLAVLTNTRRTEAQGAARRLATDPSTAGLGHLLLAWDAADRGDSTTLGAWLRGLDSLGTNDNARGINRRYADAHRAGLLGLLALRRGDTAAGRAGLAAAQTVRPYNADLLLVNNAFEGALSLELARVERAVGALDVAQQQLFDGVLRGGVPQRAQFEELRAQIAEQRGDTATAIRAYRAFVALWENADPELQPRVQAARAALARLEAR